MKFTLALLPLFALAMASPAPAPFPAADAAKASVCTILADGVIYRTGPGTNYTAVGQYAYGTPVTFNCYRVGQNISGNPYWDRNTAGYYVSDFYVSAPCPGSLPAC